MSIFIPVLDNLLVTLNHNQSFNPLQSKVNCNRTINGTLITTQLLMELGQRVTRTFPSAKDSTIFSQCVMAKLHKHKCEGA